MNQIKCIDCVYFDRKYKGAVDGVPRASWQGWCAKRSIYPTKEQDGQVFPPDVQRAAPGAAPKIVIVKADAPAIPYCLEAVEK